MKKTLITILALGGICGAVENSVTLSNILPAFDSAVQITSSSADGWDQKIGGGGATTAEAVLACLTATGSPLGNAGWHWGVSNAQNACTTDFSFIQDTTTGQNTGFQFTSRPMYNGEFVAVTIDVNSLISSAHDSVATAKINSLTINFGAAQQGGNLRFSVWSWDGAQTVTSLSGSLQNPGTTFSATFDDISVGGNHKIIMLFGDNTSPAATNQITNFTASATLIPEPATATLSLLALAGLAARRRRK